MSTLPSKSWSHILVLAALWGCFGCSASKCKHGDAELSPEAEKLLRDGDRGYRAPYVVPEEV